MDFRTILPVQKASDQLIIGQKILTMGSCFAESIGQKLTDFKFTTQVNPFGTIYDPLSIARLIRFAIEDEVPFIDSYVVSQGIHTNLFTHSEMSGMSKEEVALKIQGHLNILKEFLSSADWLFLTFGTANIYTYSEAKIEVANCHKLPASQFSRRSFSSAELLSVFVPLITDLHAFNPNLKIVTTVSPVRHVRDGLSANNLSKSILRVFAQDLSDHFQQVSYYPAYEIMMDDLRDYRFYTDDLIHPSNMAIEYIWQHFLESFADNSTQIFVKDWLGIQQALGHRPFHPTSSQHQAFLISLRKKLEKFAGLINVEKELQLVESQLVHD
jgi:hypothetical protein